MGEYIIDRWMPDAIRQACDKLNFSYTTYSDDWIIRVQSGDKLRWVFGYSFDLNAYAASQNANDKVACYQILADANVPALPHLLIRSQILTDEYIAGLRAQLNGSDIVLKPLTGTSGHDITRHSSVEEAIEYARGKERPDWCLSPLVEIVSEKRLFMLDDEVLLAYEKTTPTDEGGIRYFNLGKGAQAVIVTPTPNELALARGAMQTLGLRVTTVDIITLSDGSQQIIEVNCGITMEHFMRQSEEFKTIGYETYKKLTAAMMQN